MEAQARGTLEILTKQANGFAQLVNAAEGDAQKAVLMMISDRLPELVKTQVEAVKGIKIDKVTVWDGNGGKDGKTSTANFISGLMGTTDMETPKSTVIQVYSDYSPYTVHDDLMAKAVSYVLDQIYVDTMREDEGGTYGASSSASSGWEPESISMIQVAFECKPEMADKLKAMAKDGLRKLAEEGPTDEQFTRTVENFKKNIPESRINNNYWMSSLIRYLLLVLGVLFHFVDLTEWIGDNTALMILLAIAVGLIPESGPHLVFVTLFASGVIPFPVLLANSIVQDGHASLPLIADSKSSFVKAKAVKVGIALIVFVVWGLLL